MDTFVKRIYIIRYRSGAKHQLLSIFAPLGHWNYFSGSTAITVNVPGLTEGRGLGFSTVFSGVDPNSAVDK